MLKYIPHVNMNINEKVAHGIIPNIPDRFDLVIPNVLLHHRDSVAQAIQSTEAHEPTG